MIHPTAKFFLFIFYVLKIFCFVSGTVSLTDLVNLRDKAIHVWNFEQGQLNLIMDIKTQKKIFIEGKIIFTPSPLRNGISIRDSSTRVDLNFSPIPCFVHPYSSGSCPNGFTMAMLFKTGTNIIKTELFGPYGTTTVINHAGIRVLWTDKSQLKITIYGINRFCYWNEILPRNRWIYLAFTWKPFSSLNVYIDGKLSKRSSVCINSSMSSPSSSNVPYYLGSKTDLWSYYDALSIWDYVLNSTDIEKTWVFMTDNGGDTTISISLNLYGVPWNPSYQDASSSSYKNLESTLQTQANVPTDYFRSMVLESFSPTLVHIKGEIVTANMKFKFSKMEALTGYKLQLTLLYGIEVNGGISDIQSCSSDDNFFCETPILHTVVPTNSDTIKVCYQANFTGIVENNSFKQHTIIYNVNNSIENILTKTRDLVPFSFDGKNISLCRLLVKLTPYTAYCVRVGATSFKSGGFYSQDKCVRTFESAPIISPDLVTGVNITEDSITVMWRLLDPQDPKIQGVLRGYLVNLYSLENNSNFISRESFVCGESNIVIYNDLFFYTKYNVSVRAFTKEGIGPARHVVMTTKEKVPIIAPSNVKAFGITSNQFTLQWQLLNPEDRKIRGKLLGYCIRLESADSAPNFKPKIKYTCVNTSSIAIHELWPYTKYQVSVAAFNLAGTGYATRIIERTSGKAPGKPPSSLKACSVGAHFIQVEWTEVDGFYKHGVILGYRINCTATNSSRSSSQTRTVGANINNVVLNGLTESTEYYIGLSAYNSHGESDVVMVLITTNVSMIPDAPTNLMAWNTSSTSLSVSWQAEENGFLEAYNVTYSTVSGTHIGVIITSNMTADISGLSKFTYYNISVIAVGKYGMNSLSQFVVCRTDIDVPALPPVHLNGFNTSTQSIFIQWDPVPKDSEGGEILGYSVNYNKSNVIKNHSRRKRRSITPSSVTVQVPVKKRNFTLQGLEPYSLYSFRVAAYNSKGTGKWSPIVYIRSEQEVPQISPANVSARNTSSTSINVTWQAINPMRVRGVLTSYFVSYAPLDANGNVTITHQAIVPLSQHSVELKGLRKYTNYSVTVGGVTRGVGVRSQLVVVRTNEDTPDKATQNITSKATGHSSILISWLPIPASTINGILRGLELFYKKTQDFTSAPNITVPLTADKSSFEVKNLDAFTSYSFWMRGYTSVGYGVASNIYQQTTDESVPSKAPLNVSATNLTTDTSISVTWKTIPPNHVNGVLRGYRLYFKQVMLAGDVVDGHEKSLKFGPTVLSTVLQNLDNFAVYEIKMLGFTLKGDGVLSEPMYAETCACSKEVRTSWHVTDPYVAYNKTTSVVSGLMPSILQLLVGSCCGSCGHGLTNIEYHQDGQGKNAMKTNVTEFLRFDSTGTDLQFPVNGYKGKTMHGENPYVGLVTSPGVAFITVNTITKALMSEVLLQAILNSWTLIAVMVCMVWMVGIITWFLDKKENPENFSPSFLKGAYNGIWMSFITITTLGYGDCVPKSVYARVLTIINALMGFVMISLITANLSNDLVVTTVMADKHNLYMAKVGAITDTFEYRLGIRRNALVNTDRQYHSFDELHDAMATGEVQGILVDLYVSSKHKELFQLPQGSVQISKLLEYDNIFGVALGGRSKKLQRCFNEYINFQREKVFQIIDSTVSQPDPPEESTAQTISSGLIDPNSKYFQNIIKYSLLTMLTCAMTGLIMKVFGWLRERSAVTPSTESNSRAKRIQDMKKMVEMLHKRISIAYQLKAKHIKELKQLIKQKGSSEKYRKSSFDINLSSAKKQSSITPADLYKKKLVTSGVSTA